jgi:hypothetical protein
VWATERADAYPGLSYVAKSGRAAAWSASFEAEMHEVRIETNVFALDIVCHDLKIDRMSVGDPRTGTLTDLQQPERQ